MKRYKCHDCGVIEGQIHKYGCDTELCPFCGNQLISCDCCYIKLGFDLKPQVWIGKEFVGHPTDGLPGDIYNYGLTDDLTKKWHIILEKKGRIPYIMYPNICGRCGKLWPDMFNVSDEEWEKYVPLRERRLLLCQVCYKQIKEWIDTENGILFDKLK